MQDKEDGSCKRQDAAEGQEKALEAALRQAEEKEASRRHKARRYFSETNNWIAVLTFGVVVIYTLVTGALWIAQLKANAINSATYEASSRPWVRLVDLQPISLASDNEAGITFSARVAVKNVGHSPAENVSISADLIMDQFDPALDQSMFRACKRGQTGAWVIPGRPVFPDQSDDIDGDIPSSFSIFADQVRAARAARIKSTYENRTARESSERTQAWADAVAQYPFYAALYLVGCINYRSPDNRSLYQTSFMFGLGEKGTGDSFPLLSKDNPVSLPPTPMPNDPDGIVVHARKLQRIVPGDRIKLTVPLYGVFAN